MRLTKVLAIIAFIFIGLALYTIAITPPATGYELDIYQAYPTYFWAFLIVSIACGICILVRQAFFDEKSNWWLVGLLVIISSNLIILFLPVFRGYVIFGRADAMSHLGYMKDILITGHIGENFYPMLHILGASILDITGLSNGVVGVLIYALFSIIYIIGVYLLASVISRNRGQALLITAFAAPFMYSDYHAYLFPAFSSLFMLPLLLYLYHRLGKSSSNKVQWTILVLILALHIVFHHPVTALFVIAVFLSFGLSSILYRLVAKYKKSDLMRTTWLGKNYGWLSLILIAASFIWIFSSVTLRYTFLKAWRSVFYQIGYSTYQELTESLPSITAPVSEITSYLFNNYGAIIIYFLISLVALIFILRWSLSKRIKVDAAIFTYGILTVGAGLSMLFFWFGWYVSLNVVRAARFLILMSTILNGLVVYELASEKSFFRFGKGKFLPVGKIIIAFTALLIISATFFSVFNIYRSPRIDRWNMQVTRYEIEGVNWLLEYNDGQTPIQSFLVKIYRFKDLELGGTQPSNAMINREYIPPHFGYDINDSAAETFDFQDNYLVTAEIDRQYPMVFPEHRRYYQYTEDDFLRMNSDATVTKIYANGELEIWRVYGEEAKQD